MRNYYFVIARLQTSNGFELKQKHMKGNPVLLITSRCHMWQSLGLKWVGVFWFFGFLAQHQNCIEVHKQSETHLQSDICWPIWLSPHLDNAFLWNNDADKPCTIPNKTSYYTRLFVIGISTSFSKISVQTRKESIETVL